jgi:hypothetical protein
VGGSALTIIWGLWANRGTRRKIIFKDDWQKFSLPDTLARGDGGAPLLRVTFGGIAYDNLSRKSYTVENSGKVAVPASTLVVQFPLETQVIHNYTVVNPVPNDVLVNGEQTEDRQQLTFSLPALEPGDEISISIFFNGKPPTYANLRNVDGVKLIRPSHPSARLEMIGFLIVGLAMGGSLIWIKFQEAAGVTKIEKDTALTLILIMMGAMTIMVLILISTIKRIVGRIASKGN